MASGGKLELAEARRIMQDICAGVEFLHCQSPAVIHRDLKPGNIMLDKDGVWKIVDMNTARYYVEDAGIRSILEQRIMQHRNNLGLNRRMYVQTSMHWDCCIIIC